MRAFGVATIGVSKFEAVLQAADSPVLVERSAVEYYNVIVSYGLDPAFMLAIFGHESNYATNPDAVVLRYRTFNWGNTRSLVVKLALGLARIIQTDRGPFVKFTKWLDGLHDACARLVAPNMPYAIANARTVETIIPIWAPATDPFGNNVQRYIDAVNADMQKWGQKVMVRVAIAAGHHNTDGGNRYEYQTTGDLTEAIARHCRRLGLDVYVPQPDGADADADRGDGDYPGGIWDVAAAVVDNAARYGPFAVFLETHTQGLNDTTVRGIFGIYPDWGTDVDIDARDRLIPAINRRVMNYTGLTLYGDGRMSEKLTGVGRTGYRLGILNKTAPIAAQTTRLLIEYGSHTNPIDAAMHRDPVFIDNAARGTAEAIADFVGQPVTAPVVKATTVLYGPYGKTVSNGFKLRVEEMGILAAPMLGYPKTNEFSADIGGGVVRVVQIFERGMLVYTAGAAAPFDVTLGTYDQLRKVLADARM